jgi:hypothetical protein
MTAPIPTNAEVHCARISLRTGTIQFTAASTIALDAAIAGWCRENWLEERRKNPGLSTVAPRDDAATIEEYFMLVDTDFCDRHSSTLEAIVDPTALSDTQLADAYHEVDVLTTELSVQRAALARLLIGPDVSPDARLPEHTDEEIVEHIRAELPRRRFERRVRWSIAQLNRIRDLAQRERTALLELRTADDHNSAQALALLEAIVENAIRLSAARIAPNDLDDADAPTVMQVAYLMGVEVLVDLEQGCVRRVVIIDESIELDAEERVRAEGTLECVSRGQALAAVRIAERDAVWPAAGFGF